MAGKRWATTVAAGILASWIVPAPASAQAKPIEVRQLPAFRGGYLGGNGGGVAIPPLNNNPFNNSFNNPNLYPYGITPYAPVSPFTPANPLNPYNAVGPYFQPQPFVPYVNPLNPFNNGNPWQAQNPWLFNGQTSPFLPFPQNGFVPGVNGWNNGWNNPWAPAVGVGFLGGGIGGNLPFNNPVNPLFNNPGLNGGIGFAR